MESMMKTYGEYQTEGIAYSVMMQDNGKESILILINNNTIYSAFKKTANEFSSFNNNSAKEAYEFLEKGYKFCNSKNVSPSPFELGVSSRYETSKYNTNYTIEKFNNALCGCEVASEKQYLYLKYNKDVNIPVEKIPWIVLTNTIKPKKQVKEEFNGQSEFRESASADDDIQVRSLDEIRLEKDLTWLEKKKYYVVNDDVTAEKVLRAIEDVALNKQAIVSYDTETTGLFINKFGKIGSKDKLFIEQVNAKLAEEGKEQYRVDKLTGHILCVEKDVSYYFPVGHRKFRNLYEFNADGTCNEMTRNTVNWIKANYTVGEHRNRTDSMANFIRNTPPEQWGSDVILMERCRKILEHGHILAHNGIFEWKVSWLYNICINLKDDTMVMHKLMYKFRSTTKNMGEKSDLKFLSGKDLAEQHINQLELQDFFVGYKEDDNMLVQGKSAGAKKKQNKKKGVKIDFSYMTLEGAEAYAPADGDLTLCLCLKYKKDLKENFSNLEYLYNVELVVSCAIAYMEFYGHRIDEEKIEEVKNNTKAEKILLEHNIREMIRYNSIEEDEIAETIKLKQSHLDELNKELKKLSNDELKDTDKYKQLKEEAKGLIEDRQSYVEKLRVVIDNSEKALNLAAPGQVAKLFFVELGYENPNTADGKLSVGKKILKKYIQLKDADGKCKYPVIEIYSKWKNADTLLSKFFDNLPDYMYPGGFIFSSYGQISTATGRMSCSKPNAQQYPKSITEIVVPREDCVMIDADFSQIEYRTLVAMANEPELLFKFKDPDNDYHTMMASLMYGVPYAAVTPKMRGDAKSFNFGIPYGMGFKSLAILLSGDPTPSAVEEAKEKYELYFKEQPNVRSFFVDIKEKARNNQFTETKWHRKRYYSFLKDGVFNESRMALALRQAGNAVIQGCLDGDTRIQTKDFGIVKIKDVVNKHLLVWAGDKWSHGDITYSGKKQKCIVHFSNGQSITCSPIHKFLVKSARGNERFIECKDLKGSAENRNPHRVVINHKYEPSDFKYSSEWAHKYSSIANNSKNIFVDDIDDSFGAGVVLGRLASDRSIIKRDVGGSCILQYIAEHELNIVPKLISYMNKLGCNYKDNDVREGRNEKVNRLYAYSSSLVSEITDLDIKHQVHDNLFMDTEMLRGFLSGMFDGDGGISGKTITLTFGNQYNFEPMCLDIQKALLFFGIRSRYRKYDYRHVIAIKTNDTQKFLDLIGFVNENKQNAGRELSCVKDEHIFGPTLVVDSVDITDEYIDMYDVCNTDDGYYVADGVITHNTAADIYKIAVARTYMYIKENNLFEKFFITNMVHDEQLTECNCKELDTQVVLKGLVESMELELEGFPPLFVGAGVGLSWKDAKGKMAEIHPVLASQLIKEAENKSVFTIKNGETREEKDKLQTSVPMTPTKAVEYFNSRVFAFREQKVIDYVKDEDNWNKPLHPAVGNLLALQFDYGATKEFEAEYVDKLNAHTKEEKEEAQKKIPEVQLDRFFKAYDIDLDSKLFSTNTFEMEAQEVEDEYDDEEVDEDLDVEYERLESDFALIDESDEIYGVDVRDIIRQYGLCIDQSRKLCGINTAAMTFRKKDEMVEYVGNHVCESTDEGALQIAYLKDNNTLFYTGVYVKDITGSRMSGLLKLNALAY